MSITSGTGNQPHCDGRTKYGFASRVFALSVLLVSTLVVEATPSFQQNGNLLVMSNGDVQVQYNLNAGSAAFYWQNSDVISSFYAAVTNGNGSNLGYLSTAYASRSWGQTSANTVVVTNTGNSLPTMLQYFTLDQNDSFLVSVSLTAATNLQSRWMAPLVVNTTGGVNLGSYNDDRALFVPFDNDTFVSYNSESINGSDTGSEVGAFYDNTTRIGLVVGSVTHDTWKTGVYWSGANNSLNTLTVFGGLTNHWTWDVVPHGSGQRARRFLRRGFSWLWRRLAVDDGELCRREHQFAARRLPGQRRALRLEQLGRHQLPEHINYTKAVAVSDSIHTNLQPHGFTNGGTVYVNLDSYWNNLDRLRRQVTEFVAHCHANGQKAGDLLHALCLLGKSYRRDQLPGARGLAGQLLHEFLRHFTQDANGNYIHYANGNAYAIDPTNPHAKGYIDYYTSWFKNWGFDYVKMDFLSLGALEGVHTIRAVTTGIQAYNEGMQYLLNDLGGTMFISESIAPLFPVSIRRQPPHRLRRATIQNQQHGLHDEFRFLRLVAQRTGCIHLMIRT